MICPLRGGVCVKTPRNRVKWFLNRRLGRWVSAIVSKNNMFDAAIYAIFHRALSASHPMLVFSFSIWISTSRGCKQHIQSCTNEDTECCWWYHGWSPWRTCQICDETMLRLVLLFVFQSCCFELSTFFRCISDSLSMLLRFTFDQVSTHVRFNFDQVSMHVRFISNHDSHDLHFDELQVGLRRTMFKFPCYVNRGLWDAIPLPRTTPDKHVELSSVCDCTFVNAAVIISACVFQLLCFAERRLQTNWFGWFQNCVKSPQFWCLKLKVLSFTQTLFCFAKGLPSVFGSQQVFGRIPFFFTLPFTSQQNHHEFLSVGLESCFL